MITGARTQRTTPYTAVPHGRRRDISPGFFSRGVTVADTTLTVDTRFHHGACSRSTGVDGICNLKNDLWSTSTYFATWVCKELKRQRKEDLLLALQTIGEAGVFSHPLHPTQL